MSAIGIIRIRQGEDGFSIGTSTVPGMGDIRAAVREDFVKAVADQARAINPGLVKIILTSGRRKDQQVIDLAARPA